MATFPIQAVNEPATGRGLDLKMEMLLRISCAQQQVKDPRILVDQLKITFSAV
jgi:hypothetical protein